MTEVYTLDDARLPDDKLQRRALLLVGAMTITDCGGDVRVAFVGDQIVIASKQPQTHELDLVVDDLEEWVDYQTEEMSREMSGEEFEQLMLMGWR